MKIFRIMVAIIVLYLLVGLCLTILSLIGGETLNMSLIPLFFWPIFIPMILDGYVPYGVQWLIFVLQLLILFAVGYLLEKKFLKIE